MSRRRMKNLGFSLLACGAAVLLPVHSLGQQNVDPRSLPTFRAETRIVLLDVIATDKSGKPVLDLKQDEVTIREDNRVKEIRAFELITLTSAPPTPTPAIAPTPLPLGTFSNAVNFNTSKPLSVILFDSQDMTFSNQAYARDMLIAFLDTVPAGDPVALFTLGRRLRLAQDFTTDMTALKNALHHSKDRGTSLGDATPADPSAVTPANFGMSSLFSASSLDEAAEQALKDVQQGFNALDEQGRCVVFRDAAQSLVRTLSGIPGRKNVIWIADYFPLDPSTMNGPCPNVDSARTAELLASAQVAIYPVDAAGLVTYGIKAADEIRIRGRNSGPAYRSLIAGQADALAQKVVRMKWLADTTGGKDYSGRNDLDKVFADILRESSTYYTLAYYADKASGPNPRARHITVKVSRPGVQLRYRNAYVAHDYTQLTPKQRSRDFGVALDPESPVSTALPFRATVKPASEGKVPLHFLIAANSLMWTGEGADRQVARVSCVAAVYRKNQSFVQDFTATIEGSLVPAAYDRVNREGFPCEVSIELPEGDYLLRLGVRDEHSGVTGTANARLTVPPATN